MTCRAMAQKRPKDSLKNADSFCYYIADVARNVLPIPPPGPDSCQWAKDGECDEPRSCAKGTDTSDCGDGKHNTTTTTTGQQGPDSCEHARDGVCDAPPVAYFCHPHTDETDCKGTSASLDYVEPGQHAKHTTHRPSSLEKRSAAPAQSVCPLWAVAILTTWMAAAST